MCSTHRRASNATSGHSAAFLLRTLVTAAGICLVAANASAQFHDDFAGAVVLPGWTWTDPGNDCSYQVGPLPGRLRMTVPPGNDLTTGHGPPLFAGPMLTVPASGDFTITTHVSVNYPGTPAAKESGLIIWKDSNDNLQFKRTNAYNSQNVLVYGNIGSGVTSSLGQVNVTANDIFLRIERSGPLFTSSFSLDGLSWTTAATVTWSVTGTLHVGLCTTYWIYFGSSTGPAIGDYLFFDVEGPGASLTADRPGLRAPLGGTIGLSVDLGAPAAGGGYLVVGSLSGSDPGFPLPGGVTLPINFDPLTQLMIDYAGTAGLFPGTIGLLDGSGQGNASVIVPAAALNAFVGISLSLATVAVASGGSALLATNAAEIGIAP